MRIVIRYEFRGKHVLDIWWYLLAALAKAHQVLYKLGDVCGSLFVTVLASQAIFVTFLNQSVCFETKTPCFPMLRKDEKFRDGVAPIVNFKFQRPP